jgi:hypothetical protein
MSGPKSHASRNTENGMCRAFVNIPPVTSTQQIDYELFILVALFNKRDLMYYVMSNAAKVSSIADDLLKNSSLYREFQAEREEILRHKWIESEKAGHDIGFERALTDWIMRHRSAWRKARQNSTNN